MSWNQNKLRLARFIPLGTLLSAMAAALVLQHVYDWQPCPLCIIQRLTVLGLAVAVALFAWSKPGSSRALWLIGVAIAFAMAGLAAAGAHLWLLAQPATGACGPGLARMMMHLVDALPGSEWLLEGSGACDDARYVVIGVPLPAWSGLAHLLAVVLAVYLERIARKTARQS